jgi:predicted transcriptional regulator
MCTGGLFTVGAIYDFFTLPRQVREANIRDAILTANLGAKYDAPKWRRVKDGEERIVKEAETVERVILKLAKQNRGIITPTEVALEARVSIEDAKKALEALVSKGFAEIRVRTSGSLVYTLPELMDSDSPLEDF